MFSVEKEKLSTIANICNDAAFFDKSLTKAFLKNENEAWISQ